MTNLKTIEKPYGLCTAEEQEGLDALSKVEGALQFYSGLGVWKTRELITLDLCEVGVYRQNPDWNPPKLDVPDWFWDNSTADWVAMDRDEMFYGYEVEPRKNPNSWIQLPNTKYFSLSQFTSKHNFNPHNIPWDQSLTKRPEE